MRGELISPLVYSASGLGMLTAALFFIFDSKTFRSALVTSELFSSAISIISSMPTSFGSWAFNVTLPAISNNSTAENLVTFLPFRPNPL